VWCPQILLEKPWRSAHTQFWKKQMGRRNAKVKRNIPQRFGIDEIRFTNCFSAPSFRIFVLLVVGWVLTVGRHTLSQVILTMELHEFRHFASIYRFVDKGSWAVDWISRCLFLIMVETLVAEGLDVLAVLDDTLNKHRGPEICGAGWQHDGSAPKRPGKKGEKGKQTGYGVCFVLMGLAIRLPGISDRVFCLPYAARLWWPKKTKVKPKGLPYKKKPQLGLELMNMTHSWLEDGQRLRVITDLAYCCETVLKGRPSGVHVTGRMKPSSALFALPEHPAVRGRGRPRKKGDRLQTPATMFADPNLPWSAIKALCYGKEIRLLVHQFTVLWYHSAGEEAVTVVFCRDPRGKYADTVLFDTDVTASAKEVVERYAARWSIEVTNRETKQLLGAAHPQCRNENAVIRTPMFAYWAYSFVVLWFVRQFSTAKHLVAQPAPWYRRKKNYTFSDMLAAARRSHFSKGISFKPWQINASSKIKQTRFHYGMDYTRIAKL